MKKLLIIFSILFMSQFAIAQAQEVNYNEILDSTTMPSDAEIYQTLEKFNFTPEQKEQLFKETKKQLQELYSTRNIEAVKQRAMQNQETLKNAGYGNILPEVQKTQSNIEAQEPSVDSEGRY